MFQLQEIINYLPLIKFNGGSIYNYIHSIDPNLKQFNDIIDKKYIYEKKFIFQIQQYKFINFFEIQELLMIIIFFLREIIFLTFVLFKILYYFKRKIKNKEKFPKNFCQKKSIF